MANTHHVELQKLNVVSDKKDTPNIADLDDMDNVGRREHVTIRI